MPRRPSGQRNPQPGRKKNPAWDRYAFAGALEAAVEEYVKLLGGGRPPSIPLGIIEILSRLGFPPHAPSARATIPPEVGLIGRLSTEALKEVHRIVVKDLHPDRGGDAEAMKAANAAWEAIRGRGGRA